jgi:hypothetical protein
MGNKDHVQRSDGQKVLFQGEVQGLFFKSFAKIARLPGVVKPVT